MLIKRQNAETRAVPQAALLPGNIVAVVLQLRNDDLIPWVNKLFAKGVRQ